MSVRLFLAIMMVALSACRTTSSREYSESDLQDVLAVMDSKKIDYKKRTHIFLVGDAHSLGNQPFYAAYGRALRVHEIFPDDQVVFYGENHGPKKGVSDSLLGKRGIQVVETDSLTIDSKMFVGVLERFDQIAGVHFYGHSSPWRIHFNDNPVTIDTKKPILETLTPHFTDDAHMTMNGCNSGFYLAPFLSETWQIPITGGVTGSHFEFLYEDQQWYVGYDGMHPANKATKNSVSYLTSLDCGGSEMYRCTRMGPDYGLYGGYYAQGSGGNFGASLPFYKGFCKGFANSDKCLRNLALSLMSLPSVKPVTLESSRDDFEAVVFDHLCPITVGDDRRKSCIDGIRAAVTTDYVFNPIKGKQLQCDFDGCEAELICDTIVTGRQGTECKATSINKRAGANVTTTAKEYEAYMKGFDLATGTLGGPAPGECSLTGNANFRSNSDVTAAIIKVLPSADRVKLVERTSINCASGAGQWYKVSDGADLGFVCSQFLDCN